jgi:hypothetical protein
MTAAPLAARRTLVALVSASALALAAAPASAQQYDPVVVSVQVPPGSPYIRPYNPGYVYSPVRVNVAPPAPLVDVRPAAPSGAGSTWVPGAWNWNGAGYAWVAGHWAAPPSTGSTWIQPRWEQHDGYLLYYPGYWSTTTVIAPVVTPVYQPGAMPLYLGATTSGELRYGMPTTSSGALYTDFAVTLYAGRTATFVLHGGASWTNPGGRIDPLMQLFGSGQLLTQDDDGAGNLDSRIQFTPTWTGTYVIRVTTYGSGANQGNFTLVTRDGAVWSEI